MADVQTEALRGCGDGACVVRAPSGMQTNAGCQCDAQALRRAVQLLRARVAELEAALAEADDALDWIAEHDAEVERQRGGGLKLWWWDKQHRSHAIVVSDRDVCAGLRRAVAKARKEDG